MKFREFVGEQKVKEVKKVFQKKEIVKTIIGPTEKDFLEKVAREKPDGSKIKSGIETYLGYGLSKKNLKRVFDYIKSWLIRYDVPFEAINPYLTLYLLDNLPKIHNLINKIRVPKSNIIYKPLGTLTVISRDEKNFPRRIMECNTKKDQLVLDYIPNLKHKKILENIYLEKFNINIINRFCHVKLFEIENGILTPKDYKDMMYSCPKIPNLKLGNVGLIRRKRNATI